MDREDKVVVVIFETSDDQVLVKQSFGPDTIKYVYLNFKRFSDFVLETLIFV